MADHTVTISLNQIDEEISLQFLNGFASVDLYLQSIVQERITQNREAIIARVPVEIREQEIGLPVNQRKKTIAIIKTMLGVSNTYTP